MTGGKSMVKDLKKIVLDLIYPANIYCISCDRPIDGSFPYSLCPACAKRISWANKNCCLLCGKSIEEDQEICYDCGRVERNFDKGVTVTDYGLVEREIIHDFKYRDKSYLKGSMALLMSEKLQTENLKFDWVIGVPMHESKRKDRGYNQADLLAKEIAQIMGKEYYSKVLIRTKDTKALSGMEYHMRKTTVENVFQVGEWVKNIIRDKDILLVDDILTTGSTASACSRVLKEANAGKVYVLSFASGTAKGEISEGGIARVCG